LLVCYDEHLTFLISTLSSLIFSQLVIADQAGNDKLRVLILKVPQLCSQSTAALYSNDLSFVSNNKSFVEINKLIFKNNLLISTNNGLITFNHRVDFFNRCGDFFNQGVVFFSRRGE